MAKEVTEVVLLKHDDVIDEYDYRDSLTFPN